MKPKILRVDNELLAYMKSKGLDYKELAKMGFIESMGFKDIAVASVQSLRQVASGIKLQGIFHSQCFRPNGELRWEDTVHNLVVNEGLNYALNVIFGGVSPEVYQQSWYVGLVSGLTSPLPSYAAADTLSSHSGWSEFTAYTGANSPEERPALTIAAASSQSRTNSANKASFSINSDSSNIDGCFITTSLLKGNTTGTLFSAGQFTGGNKAADNGDTLDVTYTLTAADA